MATITVLTPTYNRANNLIKCYNSLLYQTVKDFEWLIVDDGSVDDTMSVVNTFISEKKISIRYIHKDNGGKHTALNYGVKQINTELTVVLDSDDYFSKDAIQEIIFYYNKYKINRNLCGFTFLKKFTNGNIIGMEFPIDEEITNFIDIRLNRKIRGDKCEVFYTKCLKEYPFPEYEGEKFIGESTVWTKMALKYDMVHINKGVYMAEYLEDGLTKNGRKLRISCPNGGMANSKMHMIKQCRIGIRIKSAILFNCYAFFAKKAIRDICSECEYKLLTLITMPFGYLLFRYWKHKYN